MEEQEDKEDQEYETSEEEKVEETPVVDQSLPFEAINLVPHLRKLADTDEEIKEFLDKKLPTKVCEEFKEDWDSASEWRKIRKDRMKLMFGILEPKSFPWENCANGHLPAMLKSTLRIATRIYSELVNDRDVLATCEVIGEEEQSKAMTLFMNQQFNKLIPDFKVEMRRALFEFCANGDAVFDSYYDVPTGRFRHEFLGCEDIAFPYVWKSTAIDMSDIPRKTKILRKYKREIEKLEEAGIYSDFERVEKEYDKCDEPEDGKIDYTVKDTMDKHEGRSRDDVKTDKPYTILEYHGWVKFPGEDDERPVVVSVEHATRTVLGLYTRETEDLIDLARHQKQTIEFEQYVQAVKGFMQASQMEMETHQMMLSDAVPNDEEGEIRQAIMAEPISPPEKPAWIEEKNGEPQPPKPVRMIPIERFSKRSCIENPDGSLGLGFGTLLQPFNEAANTVFNQFIDSATRANTSSVIVDANMFPEGVTNIEPGRIIQIKNFNVTDIKSRIYEITSQPANAQLANIAQLLCGEADEIASAPAVFSGEREGTETYRGQAGRIEQATKQLSVIAERFVELLSQLIKNQARLNSQFLPDSSTIKLLDPRTKEYVSVTVSREMFLDDFETTFSADLRFASQAQRIAEADDTLALLTRGVPPMLQGKLLKPQIISACIRKCLKARGQDDLLQYVNTDEEVQMAFSAPPPPQPGAPIPGGGGAPAPGGAPSPSIPDGQGGEAPGEQVSTSRPPEGSPVEAGASQ